MLIKRTKGRILLRVILAVLTGFAFGQLYRYDPKNQSLLIPELQSPELCSEPKRLGSKLVIMCVKELLGSLETASQCKSDL